MKKYQRLWGVFSSLCKLNEPIIKVADAEAEAERIKASARIEVSEIQRRAVVRLFNEEGRKQENIEKIAINATSQLEDSAKPEDIDNDWIANFF